MEQFGVLSLGSRLKRLSDYLYNEVQSVYLNESLAISSTYFPILRLLQYQGGLSVVEISDRLGLSHPAVSKQVTKMLKDELLIKQTDSKDQRRSVLHLSEFCINQMAQVEPVLKVIGQELEYYLDTTSGKFLEQLSQLEQSLLQAPYALRVLLRLHPHEVQVTPLEMSLLESFQSLNMRWLKEYFPTDIYEQDINVLSDPFTHVIHAGGAVYCAIFKSRCIGTYLLKPIQNDEVELCKLAVAPDFQRLRIGERLVQHAIDQAKNMGATKITLESHTSLKAAMSLYQKFGFKPYETQPPFSVPRANIKLNLPLSDGEKIHYE